MLLCSLTAYSLFTQKNKTKIRNLSLLLSHQTFEHSIYAIYYSGNRKDPTEIVFDSFLRLQWNSFFAVNMNDFETVGKCDAVSKAQKNVDVLKGRIFTSNIALT